MATRVEFKRRIDDFAKLESSQVIAVGTTGFAGDGNRLFLNFNDVGILLSHKDARDFLEAARRAYETLGYRDNGQGEND